MEKAEAREDIRLKIPSICNKNILDELINFDSILHFQNHYIKLLDIFCGIIYNEMCYFADNKEG